MEAEKIVAALARNILFVGLSHEQLTEFLPFVNYKKIKADEEIIHEGCNDKALYILISGAVSVSKFDKELKKEVRVTTLHSGDSFGEMNLFDAEPRFATIKALFDCELISFTIENIDFFRSKGMSTYSIIMTNIAKQLNERLRRTTEVSVSVSKGIDVQRYNNNILKRGLKKFSIQVDSALIFIYSIFAVAFYLFFASLVNSANFSASLAIGAKGLSLISILLIYTFMLSHIEIYSKHTANIYKVNSSDIIPLFLITLGLLAYFSLLKWGLNFSGLLPYEKDGFLPEIFSQSHDGPHIVYFFLATIIIVVSSFLQEFIMRLGFYLPMVHVLRGRKFLWLKIFFSSLLLLVLYSHFSMLPILIMLLPNMIWGYLYSRGYKLMGLAISHIIFNLWGFYVLGLTSLLII